MIELCRGLQLNELICVGLLNYLYLLKISSTLGKEVLLMNYFFVLDYFN